MSKPTLSLPGQKPPPPPPPPATPPLASVDPAAQFADVLAAFPLPWVVGPYGDIWVAADVEQYDPVAERGEKIDGPNGTFWRTTESAKAAGKARVVAEVSEVPDMHKDMAALIVAAANALAK